MRAHSFEQQVDRFVRRQGLLDPGDRILVGVSGGPDSVALLASLLSLSEKWQWDISSVHVNHGLRGQESLDDAEFVEALGTQLSVPTVIRTLSLSKLEARKGKQSLQEYARRFRYQAIEDVASIRGATKIAVGHHADDQAETVLMWMMRGSGTGGLGGMAPQRQGCIVRPLLDQGRPEILAYLKDKGLPFRTDSTNADPVYLRNRVREELVPVLRQYSPNITKVLSRQAHILRDDHALLEAMTREAFVQYGRIQQGGGKIVVERQGLLTLPLPIQRRVLRLCLQRVLSTDYWPSFEMVQRILDQVTYGQSGWRATERGVLVGLEYDRVVIQSSCRQDDIPLGSHDDTEWLLPVPGEVIWPGTGQTIRLTGFPGGVCDPPGASFRVQLDREKLTLPLTVRSWRAGDVFHPQGMGGGRKKLQDFFSDIKVPRSQRERIPLLVAPEGIVCVGDFRADERFQVSHETTSILTARISTKNCSR